MNAPTLHRQYYPALDGLRGLAILLVVIYHNFGFLHYFFFGWLGVDLFFVLSGFLITDILLKTVNHPHYLRNFYMRRVLRIFPLYYLSLLLFLIILPAFIRHFDVHYYQENQVWLWTYLQNWLYIFKNPGYSNALNHYWSLAVEEQFYLVWPLVILLLKKHQRLLAMLALLLVAVILLRLWIWNNKVADLAYFNLYTFTRIDGLCMGSMLALLQRISPRFLKNYMPVLVLAFAGLNFIFYFINRNNQFSFPYLALTGYSTFAMIFVLLLNETISGETTLINRLFSWTPLRFMGRISYGLYIFHWPVHMLLAPAAGKLLSGLFTGTNLSIATALITTATAILISWLSFRFVESWFLKMKDRFA